MDEEAITKWVHGQMADVLPLWMGEEGKGGEEKGGKGRIREGKRWEEREGEGRGRDGRKGKERGGEEMEFSLRQY